MTFVPIEMNVIKVEWNDILQRFFLTIKGKEWSECSLTDGDQLSITDKSQEYDIVFEVKSISKHITKGAQNVS